MMGDERTRSLLSSGLSPHGKISSTCSGKKPRRVTETSPGSRKKTEEECLVRIARNTPPTDTSLKLQGYGILISLFILLLSFKSTSVSFNLYTISFFFFFHSFFLRLPKSKKRKTDRVPFHSAWEEKSSECR